MSRGAIWSALLVLTLAASAPVSVARQGSGPGSDTGSDQGSDTGTDQGSDQGTDQGTDQGSDPGGAGRVQQGAQKAADKLPPLSYVCTMAGDEDVIEDKPGKCRKCGMTLAPIRLDSVWTCPIHSAVIREQAGKCPLDGRDLVQMTMSVSWSCPGATKDSVNPGTCPDGTAMQKKYSPRAHGNHNPQHGGAFFMAPDNWHHLEGAYYASGVFRLYLYDDFTKPLPLAQVRTTTARLILPKEGKELPLVRNGRWLEARVGKLALPTAMQAKVKFKPDAPASHFDFTFEKYSRDLPAVPAATMTTAAPTPTPPPAPVVETVPASPGSRGSPGSIDAALVPVPIPETVPEMLTQLRTRNEQIKMFIDRGAFASVYVPAFQAKDIALALDAKKDDLPPERRRTVAPAVNRLVRSAYLLDAFGDLGNRQQISEAYTGFAAAVREIESAFPKPGGQR